MHRIFIQPIILSLFLIAVFSSCNRGINDIPYYPNLLRNGDFEDIPLTFNLWSTAGTGLTTLDSIDVFDGKYSMYVSANVCMDVYYNESIQVQKDVMYELSFAIKIPGSATGCDGEFAMDIFQSTDELLFFNIDETTASEWVIKKYYFTPTGDEPINLDFIVGVNGLLIDEMQLKQADIS